MMSSKNIGKDINNIAEHVNSSPEYAVPEGNKVGGGEKINQPGEGDEWIQLKGNQDWKDNKGNFWKKDKLHKDHWDVSNKKGNKIREIDFNGRELWTNGPKNK
jgi:hypothetical protein